MLPSGRVVGLTGLPEEPPGHDRDEAEAPYAAALALFDSGSVLVKAEGRPVEAKSLPLCDFHALRAILTRRGWLEERAVSIECRNCKARIDHAPCAALQLGPFVHRELQHNELDIMLDLRRPWEIPPLRVAKRSVLEVTLGPLTVEEAAPLHRALARRKLVVDAAVVRAMGILALGEERSAPAIARPLARAPEASFLALQRLFLEAHYPPRLFSIAKCPGCGARNDVDAPYDREFAPDVDARGPLPGSRRHPYREPRTPEGSEPPSFEAFDRRARSLFDEARPEGAGLGAAEVVFVVDGGVPACDEGGEPLLGSYVAPHEGDMTTPSKPAEVTVYYRTFLAIWEEDGPYDWEEELSETIEHELLHHQGWLEGHDPMD